MNLADRANPRTARTRPLRFATCCRSSNFILMMAVIFGLQFVDRSFGPILPLYIRAVGYPASKVAFVSGIALLDHGLHWRARSPFLRTTAAAVSQPLRDRMQCCAGGGRVRSARRVSQTSAVMSVASAVFGLGIGAAMTASYSEAGSVIPVGAHGAGFGVLTSASLIGMAASPFVAGAARWDEHPGSVLRRSCADGHARLAVRLPMDRLTMREFQPMPAPSPQPPVPSPQIFPTLEA